MFCIAWLVFTKYCSDIFIFFNNFSFIRFYCASLQLCAWISINCYSVMIASHELNLGFIGWSSVCTLVVVIYKLTILDVLFLLSLLLLFAIAMAVAMAYYLLLQGMLSILYRSICLAALTVFVCVLLLQYNVDAVFDFAFSLNKHNAPPWSRN